jgi:hypothetical protein
MELITAMLADGAHQAGPAGKLYVLGGQWDRLVVPALPAQHPTMAVVLVVRLEYSEALDRHQIEVELRLDGEPKGAKAIVAVTTGHSPGQSRGTPSFVPLALTFNNLTFEQSGRYDWVISIDDETVKQLPMEVAQGSLPGVGIAPGLMPAPPS